MRSVRRGKGPRRRAVQPARGPGPARSTVEDVAAAPCAGASAFICWPSRASSSAVCDGPCPGLGVALADHRDHDLLDESRPRGRRRSCRAAGDGPRRRTRRTWPPGWPRPATPRRRTPPPPPSWTGAGRTPGARRCRPRQAAGRAEVFQREARAAEVHRNRRTARAAAGTAALDLVDGRRRRRCARRGRNPPKQASVLSPTGTTLLRPRARCRTRPPSQPPGCSARDGTRAVVRTGGHARTGSGPLPRRGHVPRSKTGGCVGADRRVGWCRRSRRRRRRTRSLRRRAARSGRDGRPAPASGGVDVRRPLDPGQGRSVVTGRRLRAGHGRRTTADP